MGTIREAREKDGRFYPESQRQHGPTAPCVWTSSLQNWEGIHLLVKPPGVQDFVMAAPGANTAPCLNPLMLYPRPPDLVWSKSLWTAFPTFSVASLIFVLHITVLNELSKAQITPLFTIPSSLKINSELPYLIHKALPMAFPASTCAMLFSCSPCLQFLHLPNIFELWALIPIRCLYSQEAILNSPNIDAALLRAHTWILSHQNIDPTFLRCMPACLFASLICKLPRQGQCLL